MQKDVVASERHKDVIAPEPVKIRRLDAVRIDKLLVINGRPVTPLPLFAGNWVVGPNMWTPEVKMIDGCTHREVNVADTASFCEQHVCG